MPADDNGHGAAEPGSGKHFPDSPCGKRGGGNQSADGTAQYLERASLAPTGVKSEQVELALDISTHDSGAASFTVKMTRVGKQFRLELAPMGKGIGELGRDANRLRMLVVSDGKNEYALSGKEYTKRAVGSPTSALFLSQSASEACDLLPPVTLNGQPAYVIRSRVGDKENGMFILSYINQNTYRLMKFEGGSDAPETGLRLVGTLKSEAFNRAVSDSLFKFTPPAGAKQIPATAEFTANPLQVAMLGMAGSSANHTK